MATIAQITAQQVLASAQQFESGLYIELNGVIRDAADLLWTLGAFEGEMEPQGFRLTGKGETLRELALAL